MITNGVVAIGTVATPIDGVHNQWSRITIHNNDNTDILYLGGSTVMPASGLNLLKQETVQFELGPLEQIFAVSTKLGHNISWMRQTN